MEALMCIKDVLVRAVAVASVAVMVALVGCDGNGNNNPGGGDGGDGGIGTTYTLTVNASPAAGGMVNPASQDKIAAGAPVGISATASDGYTFRNWTLTNGNATFANANSASTQVTLTSNATITAHFREQGVVVGPSDVEMVTIGDLTWTQNLNIETDDSWCYGNADSNCTKYGRLYTWEVAMSVCESLGSGWRLPDTADWNNLVNYAGGVSVAGKKLKSTSDWPNNGNGTDDYGFSALPSGYRRVNGNFYDVDVAGTWWTATERGSDRADNRHIYGRYDNMNETVNEKGTGNAVRCVLGDPD